MAEKPAFGTKIWHKKEGDSRLASKNLKVPGLWLRNGWYWYRPPMHDGYRPKPFSLETRDVSAAISKVLEWRRKPALHEVGRWEDEVNRYIREKTNDGTLGRFYASSRKYVLLNFGVTEEITSPRQVTLHVAERWYQTILAKNGPHTAKHYIVHLRVFLEYLREERHAIAENAARQVKVSKILQKVDDDFVEKAEVRRLLAAARLETRRRREDGHAYMLQRAREREFILYMGFDAGMRKNEICEARRKWFDMTHGHGVHISATESYIPKDLEDRTVPLTGRFLRFLKREYKGGLPKPWVLRPDQTRTAKALYRFDPKRSVAEFMERWKATSIGGRRPNLHMMRHSFASNRLLDGVALFRVAKWLGDDEDTTYRHYGHLMAKDSQINRGV